MNDSSGGVFFEKSKTPEVIFISRPNGLAENFSNATFGGINLGIGVFVLIGSWVFSMIQKRRSQT